jgi:DNA-binding transcriptional regulator YdaS (Cro superfamily)
MAGWKKLFKAAVLLVGSQAKLAKAMGCSQQKVSWLLTSADHIDAEDALAVQRATDGAVSASDLRPDLWPSRAGVPQLGANP